MKAVRLEGERIILERLTTEHLSATYVSWLNDREVNMYLESTGDYTEKKLYEYLQEYENRDILFWAIRDKVTCRHIGNIKIDPVNEVESSGEYGILIGDKDYWGKGFAKEASSLAIGYCFTQIGLSKITLGVIEDNVHAVKLYTNFGFKTIMVAENFRYYGGKLCNMIRMLLSNEDFCR